MDIKTLYRPVGLHELELIEASGMRQFPPRFDWQPIFYPVLNEAYAIDIATKWNLDDEASGYSGFVCAFDIPHSYFQQFEVENVGDAHHNEIWVPSEQLSEFNDKIQGQIRITKAFFGSKYAGASKYLSSRVRIVQADITTLEMDAIVNAANNSLLGGGGVDGAIHRAAGPELVEACRALKGCATGDAEITASFNLPTRFVIHTVGPVWNNDTQNESQLLASAYRRSLELAVENQVKTLAFPSISTGAYRFPFEKASIIALETILSFLRTHSLPQEVTLVAFGDKDYNQLVRIYESWSKT